MDDILKRAKSIANDLKDMSHSEANAVLQIAQSLVNLPQAIKCNLLDGEDNESKLI